MTDNRFFVAEGPFTLFQLAAHVGGSLNRPELASTSIIGVAELCEATEGQISVYCDSRHSLSFKSSHASAVVTSQKLALLHHNGCALLLCDNPRLAFALIASLFYPPVKSNGAIHPRAEVAENARLGDEVEVAAGAVIEAHASVGARTRIGANTLIGAGVQVGEDCTIGANCSITYALVGHRVAIASNTSIGGEGFGFVPGPSGLTKIPQLGRVVIGDHVDIGNNVAIDRGSLGDTMIGADTVLDNFIHIAHNVHIGMGCAFAAQVGIAGSTTIGNHVMVGGHTAIKDHITIGNGVRIAAKSGVIHDIPDGESIGGIPAIPARQWQRQIATLARLSRPKKS